jgi:hypothetical protein
MWRKMTTCDEKEYRADFEPAFYFSNCASCQRGGGECQREVQLLRMKEDFDVTIWVGIYYDVIC